MSAFMVADHTINIVVHWLRRNIDELPRISHKLTRLGFDTSDAGWTEKLGQAMFQLNIDGVDGRYGRGDARHFRELDYRYQNVEPVSLVQVLKSLECWLYQCHEGEVPETALYKLFDNDIRSYLMNKIISTLPEYEKAVWR
jgi:hypothetical protein